MGYTIPQTPSPVHGGDKTTEYTPIQKHRIMKRIVIALLAAVFLSMGTAKALGYEEARREAWFLTDKMAYELNLTPDQFDRAYQVNLDYLMSIRTASDCYGYYWDYRDADFRCILFDWQYTLYSTLDYFYRPIRRLRAAWYYPIFDHYRRGYYYFSRPTVYVSYRGGMWKHRSHRDRSPYFGMHFSPGRGLRDRYHGHSGPAPRPGHSYPGKRPGDRDQFRPGNGNHNDGRDHNRPGNNRPDKGQGYPGNNTPNNRPGNGNSNSSTTRPSRPTGGGSYSSPGRGNSSSSRPSRDYSPGRSRSGSSSINTARSGRSSSPSGRSSSSRSGRSIGR